MAKAPFKKVGLLGKIDDRGARQTLETIINALTHRGYDVAVEQRCRPNRRRLWSADTVTK